MLDNLLARWKMAQDELRPLEEKLASAKAGAKKQAEEYMEENWPEALQKKHAELTAIFVEIDQQLRALIASGEPVQGAWRTKKETALIHEKEAIAWAKQEHPEWVVETLTPAGRKAIQDGVLKRTIYVPQEVADYVVDYNANISVEKLMNPKDLKDM